MAEIWFYHLTDSTLEAALPSLVERSMQRGWRAVIQTRSEERRDALDALLWVFRDESFVPHGTDAAFGERAGEMPVLLTTKRANLNEAQVRFVVDNADLPDDLSGYERVILLFDGHDTEQITHARSVWKTLKGQGEAVTYWQQTEGGGWEKRA